RSGCEEPNAARSPRFGNDSRATGGGRRMVAAVLPFPLAEQYQVVPVYQFRLVDITENGFDFGRGLAQNACGFLRAVIDESARDFAAVGIEAAYDLATTEFAGERNDTDRQQALAVALQRLHGARSE